MPTVEATITISIPEEGLTLEALESAVAQAVAKAGRDLVMAGCQAIEEQLMERAGTGFRRDKQRSLDLLSRFGFVASSAERLDQAAAHLWASAGHWRVSLSVG